MYADLNTGGLLLSGQNKSPITEQFKHVLVVSGDERVRRLLNMPLSSILSAAQVDSVDPSHASESSLDDIDLIVFGLSQEWVSAKVWLTSCKTNKLPPMIGVDFAASVASAVEMMRLGAADYVDSNEMDVERLTKALSLAAGTELIADQASDEIEHTGVVSQVSPSEIPDIPDIPQQSAPASDATQVSPYLSAAMSDQTQVSPYLPAAASDQTEIVPTLPEAAPEHTEVMPVIAQAAVVKPEVEAAAPVEPEAVTSPPDTEAHTSVFSHVVGSQQESVDDEPGVEATVQLSGDAISQLQRQRAELAAKDSQPPVVKKADEKEQTDSGFMMGGEDHLDFEVGPHTNESPHVNGMPKRGQFEVNERFDVKTEGSSNDEPAAPFSGAWLRMPDSVGAQAWPFSGEAIEEGTAILGNYRILEFLGVGGMASVFKAQRISDDMLFAIKLLDPTAADDSVRERFKLEFEILQSIKHKHVVQMEEQVDEGKWIYTVMEYLPGGDLKSRIRRRLKREEAVRYASQIAAALQAAHDRGVLHRDLKPANVLFRSNGTLALVDFGVAKDTVGDDKGLTKEGQMVGTPYYASPEQATGAVMDKRSDLYALGVILFEMLEGRRPFVGDTSLQVLMAHVKDPVPLLSQEWDALNDVLTQLLAKSPSDRLACGQSVVNALNEASPGDVPADLLAD